MKRFFTVYEFELLSYLKNKSFMITTILLTVLLFGGMFLPRVIDLSDTLGIKSTKKEGTQKETDSGDKTKLGITDTSGLFSDDNILTTAFSDS